MRYRIVLAAALLLAVLFACTSENTDTRTTKPVAPKVEFSIQEESFEVMVDSTVAFVAKITQGTDVACAWYIDNAKVAGTPSLIWRFDKTGIFIVRFEASNELGKEERQYIVRVKGIPLEVEFSVPAGDAEAIVGTPFEIVANVIGGDVQTEHYWNLDGVEEQSSATFSRTFTDAEIGLHAVLYMGKNTYEESASAFWSINVKDLPLEVSYSPADEVVDAMEGDELSFKATPVHGATGISYSWKLNGTEVCTESEYKHDCSAQGSFTLTLDIANAAGESTSRTWTLNVAEKTERHLLFDDFESSSLGESAYYKGNNVGGVSILQVVENPYKTSANSSSKVLVDKGSMMTNSSSGYFTFKVTTYPDGVTQIPESERAKYTKFRVKIYLGTTGFTPLLQADITLNPRSAPSLINGVEFDPVNPSLTAWNAAIKTNDWNELVYDFSNSKYGDSMNRLSNTGQLQFRVFVDFNNSGKAGADVYFDDFEFVE